MIKSIGRVVVLIYALRAVEAQTIGKCSPPVLVNSTAGVIEVGNDRDSRILYHSISTSREIHCD